MVIKPAGDLLVSGEEPGGRGPVAGVGHTNHITHLLQVISHLLFFRTHGNMVDSTMGHQTNTAGQRRSQHMLNTVFLMLQY